MKNFNLISQCSMDKFGFVVIVIFFSSQFLEFQKKLFSLSGPSFTPTNPLLVVGPLVEELFLRLPEEELDFHESNLYKLHVIPCYIILHISQSFLNLVAKFVGSLVILQANTM